jgi:hypothetical protein
MAVPADVNTSIVKTAAVLLPPGVQEVLLEHAAPRHVARAVDGQPTAPGIDHPQFRDIDVSHVRFGYEPHGEGTAIPLGPGIRRTIVGSSLVHLAVGRYLPHSTVSPEVKTRDPASFLCWQTSDSHGCADHPVH